MPEPASWWPTAGDLRVLVTGAAAGDGRSREIRPPRGETTQPALALLLGNGGSARVRCGQGGGLIVGEAGPRRLGRGIALRAEP
jgi:hypothetical protein